MNECNEEATSRFSAGDKTAAGNEADEHEMESL